eukprot:scpid94113/ scgid26833/ 
MRRPPIRILGTQLSVLLAIGTMVFRTSWKCLVIMVIVDSLGFASANPISRSSRKAGVAPSKENANEVLPCTPKSNTVNFPELFELYFSLLSKSYRLHDYWHTLQVLNMFTPLPLEMLACLQPDSKVCQLSMSGSNVAPRHSHQAAFWMNLYPGPEMGVNLLDELSPIRPAPNDKSCDMVRNNPRTICSTDYNRFPPVLCEATCKSPCGCCRKRRSAEQTVRTLEISHCNATDNALPVWELREVTLLTVSPYSCECG